MRQEYVYTFGDKKFLFGLQWQPVVGQVTTQQAKLLAKQRRAKQWVIAGHGFFVVGLSYRHTTAHKQVFSAAVCHALLYPKGLHATIYRLEENLYWLAVVHEGTPMSSGDKLCSSLEQAQTRLAILKEQHAELQAADAVTTAADFSALVVTHALTIAALHRIRRSVWRPMLLLTLVIGAVGWWQFESAPVAAAVITPEVDPYLQYWQQKNITPNGKAALVSLVSSWEQVPLHLKDWQVKEVSCHAAEQHWLCIYQYTAQTETATVIDLEEMLPNGWEIKALKLQQLWLQARVPFESSENHWLSAEQVRIEFLSQLQPIRPAFSALRLAEPTALIPSGMATNSYSPIFSQALHIEGPMRSLALLASMDEGLDWEKAVLHYRPQASATLKSSALQMTLQGRIYVRD